MNGEAPLSDVDEYIRRLGLLHELGRALDEGTFFRTTAIFIRRILPQIDRATVTFITAGGAELELFALDAADPGLASAFPSGYASRPIGPCWGA